MVHAYGLFVNGLTGLVRVLQRARDRMRNLQGSSDIGSMKALPKLRDEGDETSETMGRGTTSRSELVPASRACY